MFVIRCSILLSFFISTKYTNWKWGVILRLLWLTIILNAEHFPILVMYIEHIVFTPSLRSNLNVYFNLWEWFIPDEKILNNQSECFTVHWIAARDLSFSGSVSSRPFFQFQMDPYFFYHLFLLSCPSRIKLNTVWVMKNGLFPLSRIMIVVYSENDSIFLQISKRVILYPK